MKPIVVLSFLGSNLDLPTTPERWKKWRPTVCMGQFPDLLIDRIELFTQARYDKLNSTIQSDLAEVSPETQVIHHFLEVHDPWNFEEMFDALYQFSIDYPFDPEKEDYLINITTGTHVAQICLFILTESRHFPGKLLQLSPPKRRLDEGTSPGSFTVIDLDLSQYDKLVSRFANESREATEFLKSGIKTRNTDFNSMIDRIEQVAIHSTAPLLLTGPTGAGKSRLARRIYELKKQQGQIRGDFVEINCSTLRGDTAMSALFGHCKGAFTGAAKDRPGLLRAADGGMLFLDEIGELGLDEQSMLLRAIEERSFLPVGSDREVFSNFQLISGTNRELSERIRQGEFRDDLFARINLWLFKLPGLKDRKEDIEPNIRYELDQITQTTGRKVSFNKEGYAAFLSFATDPSSTWRGNFRDLNAAITRLATLSGNKRIGKSLVEEETSRLQSAWHQQQPDPTDTLNILEPYFSKDDLDNIDRFDQVQLAEVISVCLQSKSLSDAGRQLFAASRQRRKTANDSDRVRKYLDKFGLSWEKLS